MRPFRRSQPLTSATGCRVRVVPLLLTPLLPALAVLGLGGRGGTVVAPRPVAVAAAIAAAAAAIRRIGLSGRMRLGGRFFPHARGAGGCGGLCGRSR
jgi:hypothetical protein